MEIIWFCKWHDGTGDPEWHWLPLPASFALCATRRGWGLGSSTIWHAVAAHAKGQSARLPSPTVLLCTPASRHTCLSPWRFLARVA